MNEQLRFWQNHWRQIMGKPVHVEIEPDCDFDLHFDIWELEKERFFKLFEPFPKGQEIAKKAFQLRSGNEMGLTTKLNSEDQLLAEAKESINRIQRLFPSEELVKPQISIQYGDNKRRLDVLNGMDPISIDVDDQLPILIKKANGEKAYHAYFFLSEPLYRISSSYIPSNWILWTLTELPEMNPYAPLLKLNNSKCDVMLHNEGVLIFKLLDNV